jgi:predicted RNase H-like HicB family nuclease
VTWAATAIREAIALMLETREVYGDPVANDTLDAMPVVVLMPLPPTPRNLRETLPAIERDYDDCRQQMARMVSCPTTVSGYAIMIAETLYSRRQLTMNSDIAMRQVLIYPSDGMWVAEVPSLPGTISQGATREEAISNIREAIALMLETLEVYGDPVANDTLDAMLVVV